MTDPRKRNLARRLAVMTDSKKRNLARRFARKWTAASAAVLLAFHLAAVSPVSADSPGFVENIVVSQAGYSAGDYKVAFVTASGPLTDTSYEVWDGASAVAAGTMKDEGATWNKRVYSIDFSAVTQIGTGYTIRSNGTSSYTFPIQANVWDSYKDEMTAFYRIQRANVATSDAYPAGYSSVAPSPKVFHPAGHLDDAKSADGTVQYDLTGGWYDAGDYGKFAGNQWVTGEIALAYLRHADASGVRFDNDSNGVPDLIDEARFGSEYLLKFADQLGGAMYDLSNNAGFVHPEKSTDNVPGTSDDRQLRNLGVGGSAKAAGALAATARAIGHALANGHIDAGLVAEFEQFADDSAAAAEVFYDYAAANPDGPMGSYPTRNGGLANSMLWAETELFLLTSDADYGSTAATRINGLAFGDLSTTDYWDLRPISLAEFYPVADSATQAHIHDLLKQQAEYFMSIADDTPYGVYNDYNDFGVNEPHASYVGDVIRYYELFGDPAALRAALKGLYWIFGANPWNISWVSGIGADHVDFLHTRLDEEVYDRNNTGIIVPGAMVSGPNFRDTKDKRSVSPWYEDRPLWADDIDQWRYNEYSISIQAGLFYTIMGLIGLDGSSSAGGAEPDRIVITSPKIGDFVTGDVTIFAEPDDGVSAIEYAGAAYAPMTVAGAVYTGVVATDTNASYATRRVTVRGIDAADKITYSNTHFAVAPPLPDPSHPLLYDDFGKLGTWGSRGGNEGWVNWYNQDGGTGAYVMTTVDGRSAGKFAQTASSSRSQAKFEPWKDTIDLSGYHSLNVTMKNPGYPNARIKVSANGTSLSGGAIAVADEWTTYSFDLDQLFPLDNVHLELWLSQTAGGYGEILIDDITASNEENGTAPVLLADSLNAAMGSEETEFVFAVSYSDADNDRPHVVQVVIDGVIRDMTAAEPEDKTYSDGKRYEYATTLVPGVHSYYYRATDTTTDAVRTAVQSGPTVVRGFVDTVPPGAPTGLTAFVVSSGRIDLEWTPPADNVGVTGYLIYRDGVEVGQSAGVSYQDANLAPDTTYLYKVKAFDAASNLSAESAGIAATTKELDVEAPSAPEDLTATSLSSSRIRLDWSASTDNEGVAGYRVLRNGIEIATTTDTSYLDTWLGAATSYSYKVRAFDADGNESEWSDTVVGTTAAVPVEVIVDNTDTGSVSIVGDWAAISSSTDRYGADYLVDNNNGKGTKTVSYAPNLAPGTYNVYMMYPANGNRASNVPVDIVHAGGTDTVTVNQRTGGGGKWNLLGTYSFAGGSADSVVIRTDGTNGYVIADAVKFEPVFDAVIVDNRDIDNVSIVGAWTSSNAGTGKYGPDFLQDGNADKGAKSVTFTPELAEFGSGTYRVYAMWSSHDNRASNVPVDIVHADGTATVTLNQKTGGGVWLLLGTYRFETGAPGSVTVRTDGTNGYVVADAVKFEPDPYAPGPQP
ncbi:glycoside hydrolase family 9 protein [Cohnella cellulosilytica]|uniref:Glycoside hydrolase family 9 protein n=1 Tax=Cohnella cellulosilytica TaxID=986710 RepID=A0ABW2FGT5_9BACL